MGGAGSKQVGVLEVTPLWQNRKRERDKASSFHSHRHKKKRASSSISRSINQRSVRVSILRERDTTRNMHNNMMIASNSNSITLGVGSSTTCTFTRTRPCCSHVHVVASPNAVSRGGTFSLSLSLSPQRRSLDILSSSTGTTLRHLITPISAVNSGLEASITDSNEISAFLTDARIVVEAKDENKIQLRVDLTGVQTQKVFDRVLTNLGRTAPPVPGFRMQKGGKSSKIPKSFLVQMLGEERVTKFVIQELLNCTMADYAKKENLDVKDRKINTTQTAEELKQSFTPGNEFGFNVTIEPENS